MHAMLLKGFRAAPFVSLLLACAWGEPPPIQTSPTHDGGVAIGTPLESFAFETIDGKQLTWDAQDRSLSVASTPIKPVALVLHVFQPDCNACQAQARALQTLHHDKLPGMVVVGITHRGDSQAAKKFVKDLGITYPVAIGTGSSWAATWGRGDPMFIVDAAGHVVYSQVGFQESDAPIWRAVHADLSEGRAVAFQQPQRTGEKLKAGDQLPRIELPDLMTGRPMGLISGAGGLVFNDARGQQRTCRATLGFFSRY